jgi:spore coat protein CotH
LGDSIELYRRWYEMKGKDNPEAWRALIKVTKVMSKVTKVMSETPAERLEEALAPIMDLDVVLRFLALDVALVNGDGYWKDGSDFNLYLSPQGRLAALPNDANEGFRTGGRGGSGAQPDPLTTLDDPNKALRQKLLAVPSLRTRYLAYVGDIAEK